MRRVYLGRSVELTPERLAEAPARHRTVRTAIAWSYDLLGPTEQALFRRLGAFVGGWTIEAAEAVCVSPADHTAGHILGHLEALIDKSLVVREAEAEGAGLRLLAPIHAYALERLWADADGPATCERHARFFAELAERVGQRVPDPSQVRHFDLLDADHDNLRRAIAWYLHLGTSEAVEQGMRLTGALAAFWYVRGFHAEGARRSCALLDRVESLPTRARPSVERVKTASGAGLLLTGVRDYARSRSYLDLALVLAERAGSPLLRAEAQHYRGTLAECEGKLAEAADWYTAALDAGREAGSAGWQTQALGNLGRVHLEQGDLHAARASAERALALSRTLDDPRRASRLALTCLGQIALREGRSQEAANRFREALSQWLAVASGDSVALWVAGLIATAEQQAHWERAARLVGILDRLRQEGVEPSPGSTSRPSSRPSAPSAGAVVRSVSISCGLPGRRSIAPPHWPKRCARNRRRPVRRRGSRRWSYRRASGRWRHSSGAD